VKIKGLAVLPAFFLAIGSTLSAHTSAQTVCTVGQVPQEVIDKVRAPQPADFQRR